jgi:hypothetical protein
VDLCHQGRVDEAGAVVELVVRPARVFLRESLADRVVLAREEGVQKRESEPEVACDACEIHKRV